MRDEHQASIGRLIARLREHRGWSQRALAKWVGLDQSAISRVEAGRRRIQADELKRFADALGVSADDLLPDGTAAPHPDLAEDAGQVPRARPDPLRERRRAMHLEESYRGATMDDDLAVASRSFDDEKNDAAALGVAPFSSASYGGLPGVAPRQSGSDDAFPAAARSDREIRAFIPGPGDHFFRPELASGSVAACPPDVAAVVNDWFWLHMMTDASFVPDLDVGHSAEGRPTRGARPPGRLGVSPGAPEVLPDRLARFWRGELRIEQDDGPVPDLVPLLEGSLGIQVIVARVRPRTMPPGVAKGDQGDAGGEEAAAGAAERPVCAALTVFGTRFLFINAARPVALQRFALAHALGHLLLNHGDVVDHQIEWNRNNPLEAAANDFAEEFLAPVSAVRGWYDRRDARGGDGRRAPGGGWRSTPGAERRGPQSYERRGPQPPEPRELPVTLDALLDLANAFGITPWAALFRTRAARRLHPKLFGVLRAELRAQEAQLLPRQAFLGGLRDTLATLTPDEAAPPGEYGPQAVLRVPSAMRHRALAGIRRGTLSLEQAAELLRLPPPELTATLARLGVE